MAACIGSGSIQISRPWAKERGTILSLHLSGEDYAAQQLGFRSGSGLHCFARRDLKRRMWNTL